MDRRLYNICFASLVLMLISFDGCLARPWSKYGNKPVDGERKGQEGVQGQQLQVLKRNLDTEEMEREFQEFEEGREERMPPRRERMENKRNDRQLENETEVLRRQRISAYAFLERFGYMPVLVQNASYDPASISKAIRDMQRMYHLNMTGELDEMTMKMMQEPRCGMPDVSRTSSMSAADHETEQIADNFILSGRKWRKKALKWNLKNYHELLSPEVTKKAIRQAFKYWSDVTPLTFTETERKADINMKFVAGLHEDGPRYAFDGPGGIIGHAFYPENGNTHFDEEEDWTDGKNEGINLLIVATHELGHAIGLNHSDVPGAVMAPNYGGYVPNFKLSDDDVQGIQSLYGGPSQRRQPPTTVRATTVKPKVGGFTFKVLPTVATKKTPSAQELNPRPSSGGQPNPCNVTYKAVMQTNDLRIYIFSGGWYWRTSEYGLDPGFPQRCAIYNEDPLGEITAAIFSWITNYTYLFKAKKVWRYDGFQLVDTKTIENPGYPESPKVAITSRDNAAILLIKDGKAWTFDEELLDVNNASNAIPFDSLFPGAPMTFDSAVRLVNDPHIYFFKGLTYYKYNENMRLIVEGYPKEKAGPWMGPACGAEPQTPK